MKAIIKVIVAAIIIAGAVFSFSCPAIAMEAGNDQAVQAVLEGDFFQLGAIDLEE